MSTYFPIVVVALASIIAAITDISRFKVYNLLTYPLLLSGLAFQACHGLNALVDGLTAVVLMFGLLLYPYLWGAFGAGDVKFVAAVAAWMGVQLMIPIVLIGCISTGVYAIVLLIVHRGYREAWTNMQIAVTRLTILGRQLGADEPERVQTVVAEAERRRRLIPFSAMITVGISVTFIWKYING